MNMNFPFYSGIVVFICFGCCCLSPSLTAAAAVRRCIKHLSNFNCSAVCFEAIVIIISNIPHMERISVEISSPSVINTANRSNSNNNINKTIKRISAENSIGTSSDGGRCLSFSSFVERDRTLHISMRNVFKYYTHQYWIERRKRWKRRRRSIEENSSNDRNVLNNGNKKLLYLLKGMMKNVFFHWPEYRVYWGWPGCCVLNIGFPYYTIPQLHNTAYFGIAILIANAHSTGYNTHTPHDGCWLLPGSSFAMDCVYEY